MSMQTQIQSNDIWEFFKTDEGLLTAVFVGTMLSVSGRAIREYDTAGLVCIVLCSSLLIGTLIWCICPIELRPYVAYALLGIGAIKILSRPFWPECKKTNANTNTNKSEQETQNVATT